MQGASPGSRARGVDHPEWPDVLAVMERGVYLETACHLRGISPDAVRGAAERDPTVARDIAQARARGEYALQSRMVESNDWKREAWLLERWNPKRYHLPTKVTGVSAEDGGAPIQSAAVTVQLSPGQRRQELEAIASEARAALAALGTGDDGEK